MKIPMDTFAERAWYAYQCLPRDKRGKPPAMEAIIGKENKSLLSKLFKGQRGEPRSATRALIAEALKVSRIWLDLGEGKPPTLTGPYLVMPRDEDLQEQDPREWARKYDAIGGVPTATPNNFQIAVLFYRWMLDARSIEDVAKEAHGREDLETPTHWAERLRLAQRRHGKPAFELGRPPAAIEAQVAEKTSSKKRRAAS